MLNPVHLNTDASPTFHPEAGTGEHRQCVADMLTPADIILALDVSTKERALEFIARFVGVRHGLIDGEAYAGLAERERLGSTALGNGVAIPHARVKGLSHPVAAFVRLRTPIPFGAPDGKPVGEMVILLVPMHATDEHLQLLAEIAEMYCDKSFREGLRACKQAAQVYASFRHWQRG